MTTSPSFAPLASPLGRRCPAILMLAGAMLASSLAAFAQTTITVNDATQVASDCTLSNAIASANAAAAGDPAVGCTLSGSGVPYTIQLQTNQSYTMTTVNNYWYGPNALPPIATTIVIEGNGATLKVTGSSIVRLRFFFVGANPAAAVTMNYNTPGPGNLTLNNLTLSGGRQLGGNGGGGGAGMGGAIFNQGTLTINQVTFEGNKATGGNGDNGGSGNGGGGMGSDGNGNNGICGTSGGGFGGAVTPAGSMGGAGSPGEDNFGEAGGGGGGFATSDNGGAGNPPSGGAGGGVTDGLGGNGSGGEAGDGSGGGADQHSVEVFVSGPSGGGFGFGGGNGNICPIGGLAAAGGGVGGGGGQGNLGGGGGGFGGGGGASGGYGGFGGGSGGFGGGAGNGGGAGFGGAIFNHNGTLQVTNSTFNGNIAKGGTANNNGSGFGGAIFNLNGTVTLTFATLAGNTADDGGAVYNLGYNLSARTASLSLEGSILSDSVNAAATAVHDLVNNQPATVSSGASNVATATVTYQNANIVVLDANTGGAVSGPAPITTDPGLAPLALNAPGSTATMAITSSSSAYEATACGTTMVDQRGVSRPQVAPNCDIGAYELIVERTVTPSVNGGNGTISPNTPQTVNNGATATFTLTPNTGYAIGTVGGTCAAGTLSGSTYKTGPVTANCTVIANFTIDTYTVTPSVNGGNGTISPNTPQTVNYDATATFTLTPNTGYAIGPVGGTCPAGTLSGSTYTTGAVTSNCTVIANFDQRPAITSANHTTFGLNEPGSFQIKATGLPTPTISTAGPLPKGVTLSSSGLLSGTPAMGSTGTYHFVVVASNGVLPNATQNFTLTVAKAATTCSVYSSSSLILPGQPITFTGYVNSGSGPANSATGTFTFELHALSIITMGTAPVETGTASLTYLLQPPPSRQFVKAIYSGDANFKGCQSAFLTEEIP